MKLRLGLQSGLSQEKRLQLKEPTSDKESLMRRLRAWLEERNFSEPVNELELSLVVETDRGRKAALWPQQGLVKRELVRAASELRKRFGYQPIKKTVAIEPQPLLPEKRFRLIDLDD